MQQKLAAHVLGMQKNRSRDILPTTDPHLGRDRLDHLRALDRELPDFAWHIICGYQPMRSRGQWAAVRELVVRATIATKPRTHVNARRLMTMNALFAIWVWTTTGVDPSPERVFTETNLHRYLHERLRSHSDSYRYDTARQISATGEALTGASIDRLPTPGQAGRVAPYTNGEIAALHSWAASMNTDISRRNAHALLGLAGGAGLSAQELMAAQVGDIADIGGHLAVNVHGDHPRQVPVLSRWARTLLLGIDARTDGPIFHGYRLHEYSPRILQTFISDHPFHVRPSATRLHNTWFVTQLDAGTPLRLLLQISGLTSTQALLPYLPFTRPVDVIDFLERITGDEVA